MQFKKKKKCVSGMVVHIEEWKNKYDEAFGWNKCETRIKEKLEIKPAVKKSQQWTTMIVKPCRQ